MRKQLSIFFLNQVWIQKQLQGKENKKHYWNYNTIQEQNIESEDQWL
jgi:hypothetical protein